MIKKELPRGDYRYFISQVVDHSGRLKKGDLVKFTVGINPKKNKLQALNVRKVNNRNNGRKK